MRRILTAALGALLLAACGEEPAGEPSGPDFERFEADQVMIGVEHYLTEDGVRRAHLRADTVYFVDDGQTALLRDFTVDFFGGQGARTSVLTARDGRYDLRSGDMRAEDDVVVVDADDRRRLRTERLTYVSSTNLLESDVDFTLVRGRDTLRGTGFVTNPGLDSLVTRRPSVVSPGAPETEAGSAPGSVVRPRPPRSDSARSGAGGPERGAAAAGTDSAAVDTTTAGSGG